VPCVVLPLGQSTAPLSEADAASVPAELGHYSNSAQLARRALRRLQAGHFSNENKRRAVSIHFLNLRPFHFCDIAKIQELELAAMAAQKAPIGQRNFSASAETDEF
jgi:hypothetical protein